MSIHATEQHLLNMVNACSICSMQRKTISHVALCGVLLHLVVHPLVVMQVVAESACCQMCVIASGLTDGLTTV